MARSSEQQRFRHFVENREAGVFLDDFVARFLDYPPRIVIRRLIGAGRILVSGEKSVARYRVQAGDVITGAVPKAELIGLHPVDVRKRILFQDEHVLVLDKPAGHLMVPGRDAEEECLRSVLHTLLAATPDLPAECPWVVHRLDRDTSGVCVWAKTAEAHRALSMAFEERRVKKTYLAIVGGDVEGEGGAIDLAIEQHPKDPMRMRVSEQGQEAHSDYRVVERFRGFTLVSVQPRTGRTHQVRVHLAGIRHSLVIDPLYGSSRVLMLSHIKPDYRPKAGEVERPLLDRTPLHALELTFPHPVSGADLTFRADVPDDMDRTIKALRRHRPAPGPDSAAPSSADGVQPEE